MLQSCKAICGFKNVIAVLHNLSNLLIAQQQWQQHLGEVWTALKSLTHSGAAVAELSGEVGKRLSSVKCEGREVPVGR